MIFPGPIALILESIHKLQPGQRILEISLIYLKKPAHSMFVYPGLAIGLITRVVLFPFQAWVASKHLQKFIIPVFLLL